MFFKRRLMAGAASLAAVIAMVPAAQAATFDIGGYSLAVGVNGQVHDISLGVNEAAGIGQIALYGTGASAGLTLYAYCIDIKDWLTGGSFSTVTAATLPAFESRFGYTDAQLKNVGYLLAQNPTASGSATTAAALQAAIWEVLGETNGTPWDVTSDDFYLTNWGSDLSSVNATANGYLNTLSNSLANHTASMGSVNLAIIDPGLGNQPQAYLTTSSLESTPLGPVPEPTSWAMMVMGFGALGAALRRRKQEDRLLA